MRASHETLAVSAACAACMRKSTEVVERAADCDAVQSPKGVCVCVRARVRGRTVGHALLWDCSFSVLPHRIHKHS